jgi:hypothetical protein
VADAQSHSTTDLGKETKMKVLKNMLAVAAAVAMVGAPAIAAAAPASKLSVSQSARVGSVARKSSKLQGGSTIIALLAAAAIIGGIAIAAGGSNSPKSP